MDNYNKIRSHYRSDYRKKKHFSCGSGVEAFEKFKSDYLSGHPECVECGRPATEIWYTFPPDEEGWDNERNVSAMCADCKRKIENARLFKKW